MSKEIDNSYIEVDDDFDEESDDILNIKEFKEKYEIIKARANLVDIDVDYVEESFLDFDEVWPVVKVKYHNGRNIREINYDSIDQLNHLISVEFEKEVFLSDYNATVNYEKSTIECIIRPLSPLSERIMVRNFRRIFDCSDIELTESVKMSDLNISLLNKDRDISIKIQNISNKLKSILHITGMGFEKISITIQSSKINKHDDAKDLLEKLSGSLFFQINLYTNMSFSLMKENRRSYSVIKSRKHTQDNILVKFPEYEYNPEPLSLYWYAASAYRMHLLQFLAYYQSVEYYFPIYAEKQISETAKRILKDPRFQIDRDADIARLVSALRNTGSQSIRSEKVQLNSTIISCIDNDGLREILSATEESVEFFSTAKNGLSKIKIPLKTRDADIRGSVSDLIYDIRCKIVHTKDDSREGELDLLLPFSKEADQILHYIPLIRYISQEVLISSSSKIN